MKVNGESKITEIVKWMEDNGERLEEELPDFDKENVYFSYKTLNGGVIKFKVELADEYASLLEDALRLKEEEVKEFKERILKSEGYPDIFYKRIKAVELYG